MIELTGALLILSIIATIALPRTTFLVMWWQFTAAVAATLGGNALLLAIIGFIAFPRALMAYLFLSTLPQAPAEGTNLYWIYLALAVLMDLTTNITVRTHDR